MSKPADKHVKNQPFLQRWSQRKLQHPVTEPQSAGEPVTDDNASTPVAINEQVLPPIESLHEESEVSMFLGENISETLKRQALRKLFHLGKFNICDGLDDYAEDYTIFEKIDVVLDTQQQLQSVYENLDSRTSGLVEEQAKLEDAAEQTGPDSSDFSATNETESTDDKETQPG